MKKIISTVFYLTLLMLALTGRAEITTVEDAIEAENIRINIDASLNGYVTGQECLTCPKIKLKIDRTSQAIKQGKTIHLHQATQLNGKFATLFFNPKTKLVTRIVW